MARMGAREPQPRWKPAAAARRHLHAAWRRTQKPRRVRDPWERQAARRRVALLEKALGKDALRLMTCVD